MTPKIEYLNATALLHRGSLILKSIILSSANGTKYTTIYDGVNANGDCKLKCYVTTGTSLSFMPQGGAMFHKGLYIVLEDTNVHLSVTYETLNTIDDKK